MVEMQVRNKGYFCKRWKTRLKSQRNISPNMNRLRLLNCCERRTKMDSDSLDKKVPQSYSRLSEEEQFARSFSRELYLKALSALVGKKCEFRMHEHTSVHGIFKGCDWQGDHILVTQLQLTLSVLPRALEDE